MFDLWSGRRRGERERERGDDFQKEGPAGPSGNTMDVARTHVKARTHAHAHRSCRCRVVVLGNSLPAGEARKPRKRGAIVPSMPSALLPSCLSTTQRRPRVVVGGGGGGAAHRPAVPPRNRLGQGYRHGGCYPARCVVGAAAAAAAAAAASLCCATDVSWGPVCSQRWGSTKSACGGRRRGVLGLGSPFLLVVWGTEQRMMCCCRGRRGWLVGGTGLRGLACLASGQGGDGGRRGMGERERARASEGLVCVSPSPGCLSLQDPTVVFRGMPHLLRPGRRCCRAQPNTTLQTWHYRGGASCPGFSWRSGSFWGGHQGREGTGAAHRHVKPDTEYSECRHDWARRHICTPVRHDPEAMCLHMYPCLPGSLVALAS
jgi:hypothetical protein